MQAKTRKARARAFIEEAGEYGAAGDVFLVAMLREVAEAYRKATIAFPDITTAGFDRTRTPFEPDTQTLVGISTALVFLKQLEPSKVPNMGSYGLKHLVEDWSDVNEMSAYIANGALIVAAVGLNFPIRRRRGGLNASIAISRKSLKKLIELSHMRGWM